MEVLYHQSQKLMIDIQNALPHVEHSQGKEAFDIDRNISEKFEEITRL